MFFVLLPILLGVAEELLWEALVWQEFLSGAGLQLQPWHLCWWFPN
jgi:hypothetical protein